MNRKITKTIFVLVILAVLVGTGIGVYFHYANRGPIVGKIEFGTEYHLTEICPTTRFNGAKMDKESYFKINYGGLTGELYLVGLEANSEVLPLIITSYKEGVKHTVIEFEYILDNGKDSTIQHLQAISTNDEIRIKAVEPHGVEIIQQNPDDTASLDYEVTILVFQKEEVK